jgi:hypothetical protein
MGNLAEMSDKEKVAFLMEALEDAAAILRRNGLHSIAASYESYVREMRGEQQNKEDSHG